MGQDMTITE